MERLRQKIVSGEVVNREENLGATLENFSSYRDMAQGRYSVYKRLRALVEKPDCFQGMIWKETCGMLTDAISRERDMTGTGVFEACRYILTQWGGSGDDGITVLRLSGIAEKCHKSWRQYLRNASFLEDDGTQPGDKGGIYCA